VLKRFVEFYQFDSALRASFSTRADILEQLPYLPAREPKLFIDHLQSRYEQQQHIGLNI
jgi:hypothetical protein